MDEPTTRRIAVEYQQCDRGLPHAGHWWRWRSAMVWWWAWCRGVDGEINV